MAFVVNKINDKLSYVGTVEEAHSVIEEFEIRTLSKFICTSTTNSFGKTDLSAGKHRVFWEDPDTTSVCVIPLDGVPYIHLGRRTYDCQNGPRKVNRKKKQTPGNGSFNEECPARIVLKEVGKFPQFVLKKDTVRQRKFLSSDLRRAIERNEADMERRIYIHLPKPSEHQNHSVENSASDQLFPSIRERIHSLVNNGITSVPDMMVHINYYVQNELFKDWPPPDTHNRRFNPSPKIVRYHIQSALTKNRFAKFDQDKLKRLIHLWQNDDTEELIHFQPFMREEKIKLMMNMDAEEGIDESYLFETKVKFPASKGDQKLMFVHQTPWQRRLLTRYGSQFCFLDAAYRSAKLLVPIFFLMVKTNVDYQIVAMFVTQDEESQSILEALQVIQHWNPTWQPSTIFADINSEDIEALQQVVPDVLISRCSAEREWIRWLSSSDADMTHSAVEEIITLLREIACSETPEVYQQRVNYLQNTEPWKGNRRLRDWLSKKWLAEHKKWVRAFHSYKLALCLNFNKGLESQLQYFSSILKKQQNNTMSAIIKSLRDEYLPSRYQSYVLKNTLNENFEDYLMQNGFEFLKKCPSFVASHCKEVFLGAGEFDGYDVDVIDTGSFKVRSSDAEIHSVTFTDPEHRLPSCSCKTWQTTGLPCKHFFAVFSEYSDWHWNSFPDEYKNSEFLTLDTEGIVFDCEMTDHVKLITIEHDQTADEIESPMAILCREVLKELESLSFKVKDEQVLSIFHTKLLSVHGAICKHVEIANPETPAVPHSMKRKREQIEEEHVIPQSVVDCQNVILQKEITAAEILITQINNLEDGQICITTDVDPSPT